MAFFFFFIDMVELIDFMECDAVIDDDDGCIGNGCIPNESDSNEKDELDDDEKSMLASFKQPLGTCPTF
jgi:hypothetical protein